MSTTADHTCSPRTWPISSVIEWSRLIIATLARALIIMVLGLAFWSAAPAALGWHPTTVMTGSMEPRLTPGDVIVSRPVAPESLVIGQVLLAADPDKLGSLRLHRYLEPASNGQLITKGDANADVDSTPIDRSAVVGVAFIKVPYVGLPILWLRTGEWNKLALLLVAMAAVAGLTRLDRSVLTAAAGRHGGVGADPGNLHRMAGHQVVAGRRLARIRERRLRRIRRAGAGGTAVALICAVVLGDPSGAHAVPFESPASNPSSSLSAASTFDCLGRSVLYNPTFSYLYSAASGSTESDSSANGRTAVLSSGASRVAGDCTIGPFISLNGSTGQVSAASDPRVTSPTTVSLESWIRTSTAAGAIISFGDSQNTMSSVYDRSLFVGADGRVVFGVYSGERTTISSRSAVTDGRWHHVVATLSSSGTRLYVDGAQVASSSNASTQNFSGWWRIGDDSLGFWPNAPSNDAFKGDLDDTTVYPTALTSSQVATLYRLGR